ncbi:hypothetical protein HDZ31DRAFT_36846 [Schizophyllum fasciatum]
MADKGKAVPRTVPPPLPSPATGSANPASSLQALWPYISPALDHMFSTPEDDEDAGRAPPIDVGWYSGIHSNVYNYCTAQSATADALSGADLYAQLDHYFAATARDILLAVPPSDASPPTALPRFLGPAFARYAAAARAAGRLLHYIDRHYVKRAVDEDRGWLRAADAFDGRPPPVGLPRAELAARLRAHRLTVLRAWGWDEADTATRALAEAAAEAGSAPGRVIPVHTLALRRFRTDVVEPLLAVPKAKGKKGKKKSGADPRGRLARAVKALLEPADEEQENRLRLAHEMASMLRLVGVRPDHPLRKKLDGFVRTRAQAKA